MCYSTALRKTKKEIENHLLKNFNSKFTAAEEYRPYFQLNGFTQGNLQIIKMDDTNSIHPASWGLVPDWAKRDVAAFRKKSNTLNARSETLFQKNSYKTSASSKRCLILADGFFEPHHENGIPVPYFCYQPTDETPEGELFLFAGLYNELESEQFTATIITTVANDFFAEVHNKKKRMPLVLDENHYHNWLDNGLSQQSVVELMKIGFTNLEFRAHPVSRDLYKRNIDTNRPYIVEKVDKGTLF
ncbi:MAG: SOS response-associated peptidase [Bacteroidota bacterium]